MLNLMRRMMRAVCGRLFMASLFAAAALAGCVTTDSDAPQVRVGMSRDDLRAHFGEPLRIEPASSGGEDWYYTFASWSSPQVDTSTSYDISGARTDSVSVSLSDARSTQECPVHLSNDGYVTEPIPDGQIVRK